MQTKVVQIPEGHALHKAGYEYAGLCECGFVTYGWPTQDQAVIRIGHHYDEHLTGQQMPPKEDVEALTPEAFPPLAPRQIQDTTGLWNETEA